MSDNAFTVSVTRSKSFSIAHNERSRIKTTSNVDKSRSHLNETVVPSQSIRHLVNEVLEEDFQEYKKTHPNCKYNSAYELLTGDKRRKGQEFVHEFVLMVGNAKHHPDPEISREILKETLAIMQEKFPNLKVAAAHIHMDESTPHMHVVIVPFYEKTLYRKDKNGKLREIKIRGLKHGVNLDGALQQALGLDVTGESGLKAFQMFHDYMMEIMEQRLIAHGLERYVAHNKQKHVEKAKDYARKQNKLKAEKDKQQKKEREKKPEPEKKKPERGMETSSRKLDEPIASLQKDAREELFEKKDIFEKFEAVVDQLQKEFAQEVEKLLSEYEEKTQKIRGDMDSYEAVHFLSADQKKELNFDVSLLHESMASTHKRLEHRINACIEELHQRQKILGSFDINSYLTDHYEFIEKAGSYIKARSFLQQKMNQKSLKISAAILKLEAIKQNALDTVKKILDIETNEISHDLAYEMLKTSKEQEKPPQPLLEKTVEQNQTSTPSKEASPSASKKWVEDTKWTIKKRLIDFIKNLHELTRRMFDKVSDFTQELIDALDLKLANIKYDIHKTIQQQKERFIQIEIPDSNVRNDKSQKIESEPKVRFKSLKDYPPFSRLPEQQREQNYGGPFYLPKEPVYSNPGIDRRADQTWQTVPEKEITLPNAETETSASKQSPAEIIRRSEKGVRQTSPGYEKEAVSQNAEKKRLKPLKKKERTLEPVRSSFFKSSVSADRSTNEIELQKDSLLQPSAGVEAWTDKTWAEYKETLQRELEGRFEESSDLSKAPEADLDIQREDSRQKSPDLDQESDLFSHSDQEGQSMEQAAWQPEMIEEKPEIEHSYPDPADDLF